MLKITQKRIFMTELQTPAKRLGMNTVQGVVAQKTNTRTFNKRLTVQNTLNLKEKILCRT